jgi:hypothetical protein
MICELVRQGKKVGIVANGHEVIRNLLNKVVEVADETDTPLVCIQKPKGGNKEDPTDRLRFAKKSNAEVFAALKADCSVAGGTAWLWSTEDAFESLDVLFVDEAAQMSLANVLAVSQAAKTLVLLGDPAATRPAHARQPSGWHRLLCARPPALGQANHRTRRRPVSRRHLAAASGYLRVHVRAVLRGKACSEGRSGRASGSKPRASPMARACGSCLSSIPAIRIAHPKRQT